MLKVYIYRIATIMKHSENLFVVAENKKEADELARQQERCSEGLWAIQEGGFVGHKKIKKGLVIAPL